jgi:Cu+-exporting ATPase
MTTTHADHAEPQTIELPVGGMTCQGCVANITRGLTKLDGVGEATVNLVTKRATVRPDGTVDPAALEEAMKATITGLGYEVLSAPAVSGAGAPGARGSAHHTSGTGGMGGAGGMTRADEHAAHMAADASRVADYRRRFTLAAILTVPLLFISMVPALQFGSGAAPAWEWLAFALATPVIFWSAWPFHRSTAKQARHGAVNMDTLVTIGTGAAWIWSTVVLLGAALGAGAFAMGHVYFETGAVIVTLILLGKWIEVRSTSRAGDAIRALSKIQTNVARLEDGREIALDELKVGQRFVIRPGETIATDGTVVAGGAAVDASLATGESVPVHVGVGDDVIGGTIATDGALTIEATRVGSETMLAQIARMVDEAQSRKANIQRLADRVASVFVPAVVLIALGTLAAWLLATGDVNRAFTAAVAVIIISCPCALGLATPLAIMVGTGRGAQLGTLIRGGPVLETTRRIDVIILDKTGTVTEGRMVATDVVAPGFDDEARRYLIEAIASAEKDSEHPVGRAVAALAQTHRGVKDFRVTAGEGVTATVEGSPEATGKGKECADRESCEVRVGSRRMFDSIAPELEEAAAAAEALGNTAIFAGRRPVLASSAPHSSTALHASTAPPASTGLPASNPPTADALIPVRTPASAEAVVVVRDAMKPSSKAAVAAFNKLGLEVVLLTGDNERSARAVAAEVGIDRVYAEVLPGEKADVVTKLQADGQRVAMVGDGINDAPALAQADLGIAIGTGSDVAREASDLTIVSGDLMAAVDAIRLARRTFSTIRGNLFWAFAYNVAMIPLAAFGVLNPMLAAGAMGSSSLFVVGNSMRLRGFKAAR